MKASPPPPEPAVQYTPEELALLDEVARKHGVPAAAILRMIQLEVAFHAMGRRRGLFPTLREIVRDVASASPKGS